MIVRGAALLAVVKQEKKNMDNVMHEEMKEKTASLPDDTNKMPSWLLEMTEYVSHCFIYILQDKTIHNILFFLLAI